MTRRFDASPFALALALACFVIVPAGIRAQETAETSDPARRFLLRQDLTGAAAVMPASLAPWSDDTKSSRRSPLLAAGMSLLLPGAGEVYSESYLLGGIFLAAEVTGWYFARRYDIKGDDQTALFENYADRHWSAVKYAQWLNENAKNFPGGENAAAIDINPDPTLPHWQRVNWSQMNAVEMMIPVFSHRLPQHGHQQYFELIGKYNQYSFGWDDKSGSYTEYNQISPRFYEYSLMRGKANDFYTVSERLINLVILNHVLSAVDAAWAAARFNKAMELHTRVGVHMLPSGMAAFVPEATFTLRF